MQKLYILCMILFCSVASLSAQVDYTAKTVNPAFDGPFRPGANVGYFPLWSNEQLGDLIVGNEEKGVKGVGAKVTRPVLAESVFENFGYDHNVDDFEYWKSLGMDDLTVTLTGPAEWHQDLTEYCPGEPSAMFRNVYEPIWDGGANGTPYNDDNFFAAYVYRTVSIYGEYVKFWEIWNEPGFDQTGNKGWRDAGDPQGNWWDNDPEPCDYILKAPIQHYIRHLRVAYEIIETLSPDDQVIVAGFGYQSFLDAVLRNTDNPDGGAVTAEYPHDGGAYFEVMGLHSYPHFDGTTTNGDLNFYERHSDQAAQGLVYRRGFYQEIFDNYGYDDVTYPSKHTIATEMNVPREFNGGDNFFASTLGQRNYLMKSFVTAILNDVAQFHVFGMSDQPGSGFGFDKMGLYEDLFNTGPFNQVRNEEATAMKTTSDMLYGTYYDATKTAQMNVPAGAKGYAFLRPDGKYVYMLWAETTIDQSEFAQANYSFPGNFGYSSLDRFEWDYSDSGITNSNTTTNIALDATPIFLIEEQGTGTSIAIDCPENISRVSVPGTGAAIMNWNDPSFSSDCSGATISQNGGPVSGSSFPVGTKVISYDVTNDCGQQSSCLFIVKVTETHSGLYCDAKGNQPWNEWISGVAFGGIDNFPSGKCETGCGYGDFNHLTATANAGQSHPITLTPGFGWPGQITDHYWRMWIDFNEDGDFTDAGEMVLETFGGNQVVNTSFTIPANASEGLRGVRIAAKSGGYAEPCETFAVGEVEDFTIQIGAGGGGCTTIGDPCNDNDDCTINDQYDALCNCVGTFEDTDNDGVCDSEDQCPGHDDNIDDNNNGIPDGCEGGTGDYCSVSANQPWQEWIAGVALANINNTSSKCDTECGYGDFTSLTANLSAGQSHDMTLTPGLSWSQHPADLYWRVWIDFNQDGDFTDAGEMVLETYGSNQVVNESIAIATTAPEGVTRMRIAAKKGAYATSCESFSNGEIEDYNVNITGDGGGGGGGGGGEYCDAAAAQPWQEWIAGVDFSNINNPSGKCDTECGYGDFTSLVADAVAGQSYDLTLTPGLSWSGHLADFYWTVWIDYNSDGDFEDLGEMAFQAYGNNQVVTGSIQIPANANSMTTRMRIAAKKGSYASPCESFSNGEIEDYNINLIGASPLPFQSNIDEARKAPKLNVFPNPMYGNSFFIDLKGYEGTAVRLELTNVLGQTVKEWDIANVNRTLLEWETGELHSGAYHVSLISKISKRRYAQIVVVSQK